MDDAFGDRMKLYEQVEAGRKAMPLLPVCVRLDGKNFSKYTKNFARPYDVRMSETMVAVTKFLVEETCALIGYIQSDEISLIYYSNNYDSQIFFDGKYQKACSVLASMATAKFNEIAVNRLADPFGERPPLAFFDCRAWTVPTVGEAVNTILWREQDASKNSISMAARHYYSHKELQNKNGSEMQELLFAKGVNWNDYPSFFKRGVFVQRRKRIRILTPSELENIPEKFRPIGPVERTEVIIVDMPPFSKVANRVAVVFQGADPTTINAEVSKDE